MYRKIANALALAGGALVISVSTVLADQTLNLGTAGQNTFGAGSDLSNIKVSNIVAAGLKWLIVIAALLFFIWLVWGGIKWIVSGGDKEKTESARSQITAALVGLIIVLSAFAIIALINNFFKIDLLGNLTLPAAVQ